MTTLLNWAVAIIASLSLVTGAALLLAWAKWGLDP
jgi:hypothetical protein